MWTLWQSRLITARAIERWSLTSISIAIFVATMAVAGLAAQKLTGTSLFPSGDEPHYLVIAQSLWRDGDLKIENNHERGDYREYFPADLEPHYLTRGTDGEIYSIHPIGIAVILAPVYALAGYKGSVWFLIALGALAAAMAWRWTVATLNAPGAATFAWAAIALSAPFMFNTFTVYPEIAAALAVMFALCHDAHDRHRSVPARCDGSPSASRSPRCRGSARSTRRCPPPSSSSSFSVWVNGNLPHFYETRKSGRWWRFMRSRSRRGSHFFTRSGERRCQWRRTDRMVQTTPLNLRLGAPGLLFDQEYGLLAYAPVYILAGDGPVSDVAQPAASCAARRIEITFIFTRAAR